MFENGKPLRLIIVNIETEQFYTRIRVMLRETLQI